MYRIGRIKARHHALPATEAAGFILNILSILLISFAQGVLISYVTLCEPFLLPQPGM